MSFVLLFFSALLFGFFIAYPEMSGAAVIAALGLHYVIQTIFNIPFSKKNIKNKLLILVFYISIAAIGAWLNAAVLPLLDEFRTTLNMAVSGFILGGALLYFRRAYMPVKPAFTLAKDNKAKKNAAKKAKQIITINAKNSKFKSASAALKAEMAIQAADDLPIPEFGKAVNGVFLGICCLAVSVAITLTVQNNEAVKIETFSQGGGSVSVTVKNMSDFEIRSWRIDFDGTVKSAGGADLYAYQSLSEKIASKFFKTAPPSFNSFIGVEGNKTIPPRGEVQFSYTAQSYRKLDLQISSVYAADFTLSLLISIASFLAGFCATFPGTAISLVFAGLGVGSTLESAADNFTFTLLIPAVIFGMFGILTGGKLWAKAFRKPKDYIDDWKGFYANSAFCGLMVGAAFCALPDSMDISFYTIVGFVAFGAMGAISVAAGAEIISNEEIEKTDENLLSK